MWSKLGPALFSPGIFKEASTKEELMNEKYFFSISNKQTGPLDEEAIRKNIIDGKITPATLAWRQGMAEWQPVQENAQLMNAFGSQFSATQPPPLPTGPAATPPPLPASGQSTGFSASPTAPGSRNDQAYRFICFVYRPWRGKFSPVRQFVDKDPQSRALPVAVGTIALFIVIGILWASSLSKAPQTASQQPPEQMGGAASVVPNADWRAQQAAMMDAQRYGQQLSDDSYQYRRDTQDRMDETYRRANYDWYRDNDN